MTEEKAKRERRIKRVTKRRIWLDDKKPTPVGTEVLLTKEQVKHFEKSGALEDGD